MHIKELISKYGNECKIYRTSWSDKYTAYMQGRLDVGHVTLYQADGTSIDKRDLSAAEALDDNWELYEPAPTPLELGPEHVGKRVKFANGSIGLITSYYAFSVPFITASGANYSLAGVIQGSCANTEYNIVEVLDD